MEIEHIDVGSLEAAVAQGIDVEPTPNSLRLIQVRPLSAYPVQSSGVCFVYAGCA